MTDISILVYARDNHHELKLWFTALRSVEVPQGVAVELIVVNHASNDDTRGAIGTHMGDYKFPVRRLYQDAERPVDHVYKHLLSQAKGWLGIVADVTRPPEPEWLVGWCKAFNEAQQDSLWWSSRSPEVMVRLAATP